MEKEKEVEKIISEMVNTSPYENLKEILGDRLGTLIYELVNHFQVYGMKNDIEHFEDLLFLKQIKERLIKRDDITQYEYAMNMINDWIHQLEKDSK